MNMIGLRCSNRDFTHAILTGTKVAPVLLEYTTIKFPIGYTLPQSLKWFLQELSSLYSKYSVRAIVIKADEGRMRSKSYEKRVEHEAMVYLAAENSCIKHVFRKVSSTIAKDLGLKGRAHYLKTALDTSVISGFDDMTKKTQEAILCAWSVLP